VKKIRKKTHDEFIAEMKEKHPTIKVLGEYTKSRDRILCKCLIDEHIWSPVAADLSTGYACPICGNRNAALKISKTHDQFINEMSEINPNIKILGKYIKGNSKILCECLIHETKWYATPNHLHEGIGCPICGAERTGAKQIKSNEEFLRELMIINPKVQPLDTYNGANKKIECMCLIDGYRWYITPSNLINNKTGCPKCGIKSSKESQVKSREQFIKEMIKINPDVLIVGEYNNSNTKIQCECLIDGSRWDACPSDLLRGSGCPY